MGLNQSKDERLRDVCLILTEQQAAHLDTGDIRAKTGADVALGHHASPGSGRRLVIVWGYQKQIEAAAGLIDQQTSAQVQTQLFWLQWVEAAFPDLHSRAYFLPPVYFNRVPMSRQSIAGEDVLVVHSAPGQAGQSSGPATTSSTTGKSCLPQPPRVQDSDTRDDAAMQRLLFCLQKMTEQKGEVLVEMSNLKFGQYLGEPCYAAAAAQLPLPANLPSARPRNWKHGDFDVLLIHRHYGLVICEVKAFGDNIQALNMSQQDINNNIRQKLRDAVSQLDKAEAMLSHLVSDIAPGLRITKTIAFPNLTASQVQQAISGDTQLTQNLCQCLGGTDAADIAGLCLYSEELSDPKTPWDVNEGTLKKLGEWWTRRVTVSGPDSHMTSHVYKTLVAR
ncbi:uncharacterized protein LOC112574812 [Pomacea canaliculata]|uniref:uncharacterized protein LOC112574812 n=1 Tax=Pomacea canaliculata TaxID=400727 RepID=UPI000D73BF4B|nr:uncharacterized protein LOC112574812 [Pomacea canaliculata]